MTRKKRGPFPWISGVVIAVLVLVVILLQDRARPRPAGSVPPAPQAFVYRVPQPGEADYEDYREMLKQPQFRSSVENAPGYVMPYDPEWRSVVTGRREAPATDLPFLGGEESLESLARMIVMSLGDNDRDMLDDLRISHDEFELILWPEFPQSRPYLRIPVGEAWGFHITKCVKSMDQLLASWGRKNLSVESVRVGKVRSFRNFTLYDDVEITVRDADTNQVARLEEARAFVERDGSFKVYLYGV